MNTSPRRLSSPRASGSRTRLLRLGALAVASSLALGACASPSTSAPPDPPAQAAPGGEAALEPAVSAARGGHPGPQEAGEGRINLIAASDLTDAEREAIVHMREEEKLADDVYNELYRLWGSRVFDNIAAAEQRHMSAVGGLLDRYGIPDPASTTAAGEFTDPALQALYDRLVAEGSRSLVDAFRVGATIEDLDIADLRQLASPTADIAAVFGNLEQGSRNHLRAFARQLERTGETYVPSYISQADFDAIVNASTERRAGG